MVAGLTALLLLPACTASPAAPTASTSRTPDRPDAAGPAERSLPASSTPSRSSAVTIPRIVDPKNVYSEATAGKLSPAVAHAKSYIYVPSNDDGSVTVIDQASSAVVDHYRVGKLVQHVVPSWDLRTLYATASGSNQLVPIDPSTGRPGKPIMVDAPYNLYFTPDGSQALVMAERRDRIDFYDPRTWTRIRSVHVPCRGVNHADWSVDGAWFVVTCEFSGQLLKVASASGAVLGVVNLPDGAMPQDIRLAPDGEKFFVADMMHGGLWIVSRDATKVTGSIPTGVGAHGIYPSRDGTLLYVANRGRMMNDGARRSRPGEGSVSVVDPATDRVVGDWRIPGGGSPDMGGVSADGRLLWLSGRYDGVVYAFDTRSGAVVARIRVPNGPHGLCVFPQPGRYSLGHTGNYR
jgi:DNA-binding beta-propeller fold protein YncE